MRLCFLLLSAIGISATLHAQPVEYAWAKSFPLSDNSNFHEEAIALAPNGDVVVVGAYNITVDMDPGTATELLVPSDPFPGDGFVLRLDADGNFSWAVRMGRIARRVSINSSGEVYVAGSYLDGRDLDPGPGTLQFNIGPVPAAYLVKLDPDGNLLWGRVIPCSGSTPEITVDALELAPNGDVVLACLFDGTADLGTGQGAITSNPCGLCAETFLVRFDPSGTLVDVDRLRITTGSFNGAVRIASMAFANSGELHATGYYNSVIDFDPGVDEHLDDGTVAESFLLKLDAAGNFSWMLPVGTDQRVTLSCLAVDPVNNDIVVVGYFQETTDLDPGTGTSLHTAVGNNDLCVVRFDAAGVYQWSRQFVSENFESPSATHIGPNGEVYVLGISSYGLLDLDPGTGQVPFTHSNSAFLSVLDSDGNYQWSSGIAAITGTVNDVDMAVDADGDIHFCGRNAAFVDFDPGPAAHVLDIEGNASFVAKWDRTGTAIIEVTPATFAVYPNPAREEITVQPLFAERDQSITIRDVLGRVVHTSRHTFTDRIRIPLLLPAGPYTITLSTASGASTARFIKQ